MVTAAKRAGLSGNVTNHSLRKTCISRLLDAEVPANYVAQLSGHKNLKSLDAYKTASIDHQRHMSLLLSRSSDKASPGPQPECPTRKMVDTPRNTEINLNTSSSLTNLASCATSGLFSGAAIQRIEGCSLTFNVVSQKEVKAVNQSKPKKRRIIISDDSDCD